MEVKNSPIIDAENIPKMVEAPLVTYTVNGKILKMITVTLYIEKGFIKGIKLFVYDDKGNTLLGTESYKLAADRYNAIKIEAEPVIEKEPSINNEEDHGVFVVDIP